MPEETLAVRKDVGAGVARSSSARDLNCSLKWGNERNPRPVLQVSQETAQPQVRRTWQIRNSNIEIRNNPKMLNSNNTFLILSIGIYFGFRISCFGFPTLLVLGWEEGEDDVRSA